MTRREFDRSRPVVVLAGGTSAERDVSHRTGDAIAHALRSAGIDVRVSDPAETPISSMTFRDREVAFIALHGTYGEDGRCQSDLLKRGVPFTGTRDPAALQNSFDKTIARTIASNVGLAVARGTTWKPGEPHAIDLAYPVVVKPTSQGSSVGLSKVASDASLKDALATASGRSRSDVLIEEFVAGEEWTVAVFDGHAFPPVRVEHAGELFDEVAKYQSVESRFTPLTDRRDERFEPLTIAGTTAYHALATGGLARADFIWSNGRPVFLELNTVPGMTERSLAPIAAAADGVSFAELCIAMLADAVS